MTDRTSETVSDANNGLSERTRLKQLKKQRKPIGECYQTFRQKRHDFLHKLSNYYATNYELVAVEDVDVKSMMESSGNSRNTAFAAWDTVTMFLEYKCKCEGTHFVEIEPAGTTKVVSE